MERFQLFGNPRLDDRYCCWFSVPFVVLLANGGQAVSKQADLGSRHTRN
jgi:hypothetical protein